MQQVSPRVGESGFALLAVMLGLIVISVLVLGLVLATRSGVGEAHSDVQASESRAYFDAIIMQSAVLLLDPRRAYRPRVDGVVQIISVLGQKIPVSISSEFGKVDMNAAGADSLTNLFQAVGEGPAEATNEADQVVNWRTEGGSASVRLFRILPELLEVPGISQNLYNRIVPAVTVYSGRDRIDQNTAPLLALESIGGMDFLTAGATIRDRADNQNGKQQLGEVVNGQIADGISINGWAFTITTGFRLGHQPEHAEAVIRMTGDPAQPFFVLWRQETPS